MSRNGGKLALHAKAPKKEKAELTKEDIEFNIQQAAKKKEENAKKKELMANSKAMLAGGIKKVK